MVDLMGVVRNFSEITSSPSAAAALFFFAMPNTPCGQAAFKLGMRQECATFCALGDGKTTLVIPQKINFKILSSKGDVCVLFFGFSDQNEPNHSPATLSESAQKNHSKVAHQNRVLQPYKIGKIYQQNQRFMVLPRRIELRTSPLPINGQ